MNTGFYFTMGLAYAAKIAIFVLALRVWLKRRESGFLLLAAALGVEAFLTLPGGIGTFEEFCEVLTWSQLGLHPKPCGLLNVLGYFDPLLALCDAGVAEGFIRPQHRDLVLSSTDADDMLSRFRAYVPLPIPKWIEPNSR